MMRSRGRLKMPDHPCGALTLSAVSKIWDLWLSLDGEATTKSLNMPLSQRFSEAVLIADMGRILRSEDVT